MHLSTSFSLLYSNVHHIYQQARENRWKRTLFNSENMLIQFSSTSKQITDNVNWINKKGLANVRKTHTHENYQPKGFHPQQELLKVSFLPSTSWVFLPEPPWVVEWLFLVSLPPDFSLKSTLLVIFNIPTAAGENSGILRTEDTNDN